MFKLFCQYVFINLQHPPNAEFVALSDHPLVVTGVALSTSLIAANCQFVKRRYLQIEIQKVHLLFNKEIFNLKSTEGNFKLKTVKLSQNILKFFSYFETVLFLTKLNCGSSIH